MLAPKNKPNVPPMSPKIIKNSLLKNSFKNPNDKIRTNQTEEVVRFALRNYLLAYFGIVDLHAQIICPGKE